MRLDHYFLFQLGAQPIDALSCASLFQHAGISILGPSSSRFTIENGEIFETDNTLLNFSDVLAYFENGNKGDDFSCGFVIGESPFTAGFFTHSGQRLFLIHIENKYAPEFISAIKATGRSVYSVIANLARSFHSTRMILCRDPLHSDLLSSLESSTEDALTTDSVTALLLPQSDLKINLNHINVADLDNYRLYYNGDFFNA